MRGRPCLRSRASRTVARLASDSWLARPSAAEKGERQGRGRWTHNR